MESIVVGVEKSTEYRRERTSGDGMEQEEMLANKVDDRKEKRDAAPIDPDKKNSNSSDSVWRTAQRRKDSSNAIQENVHRKTSAGSSNSSLPLPGLHCLYRRSETTVRRSLAPVIPKGELVRMTPRKVTARTGLPEHKKNKPPKFVPYEPYPGAVNSIEVRSESEQITSVTTPKENKNNLDIAVLVTQMSTIRTQELNEENGKTSTDKAIENARDREIEELKKELRKVKEERDYFQGQFKFQTQVNSELKNLLVASVGEDLQTRVNVLTEDKLQLARALLDTANNLTTHTEQIEFLAGQSEVWRSKFLASSVMVEELARWKADLTQKNQMLNEATKRLLHATHQIREMQLEILKNLKFVAKIRYLNLPLTDVISLSAENLNILQQMVLHSGVGIPEANINISSANTNPLCDAEKYAVQALEFVSQPLMATDEAIRALFGQAQRPYIQSSQSTVKQSPSSTNEGSDPST